MFKRSWWDRLLLAAAQAHCRRVLKRFVHATQRATAIQERILLEKIRRNAQSDFGKTHVFSAIRTYDDFRRALPLTDYEYYQPYIERLQLGEHQAMFGENQKVRMFALTSGSCGQPKHIPVTDHFLNEFRTGWNAFGVKALMDHPDTFLRPIVQVTSRMDEARTPAGIPCGAITGLMAATQKHLVRKYYLTPLCLAHILDPVSRYYAIMRLSVAAERVAFMVTANPATLLRLARTAAQHAPQLIRDIHDGTLWSELFIPPQVRNLLQMRLQPNPSRAQSLEKIVRIHGELLPKHYWDLGFLCNWTGGTMGMFLEQFSHYFGQTPVRDIGLIASEGRMSIPVEDGTPAGVLEITSNFYEFIPASQIDQQNPDCLRSHQLEVGQEYFIVLTNSAGFYRYSIGDQVRVVGFTGQAPMIEFLNKGAHISSMTGEKLTEHQVVTAVNQILTATKISVQGYVLAPQWADPPFYALHLELAKEESDACLRDLAWRLDQRLRELNIEYASKQESLRLGPVRMNRLPAGFLEDRHQQLSVRYRQSNEQYKHQFLLTRPDEDRTFPRRLLVWSQENLSHASQEVVL